MFLRSSFCKKLQSTNWDGILSSRNWRLWQKCQKNIRRNVHRVFWKTINNNWYLCNKWTLFWSRKDKIQIPVRDNELHQNCNIFFWKLNFNELIKFRAKPNIWDRTFCKTSSTYFCKTIHLICLTKIWRCLCTAQSAFALESLLLTFNIFHTFF